MKKTLFIIIIFLSVSETKGQSSFEIFVKQNGAMSEIEDSIKIQKESFEIIFKLDIIDNPPKDDYWYTVSYVSSVDKNAYSKYDSYKTFSNIPYLKRGNYMARSLFNDNNSISITKMIHGDEGYGSFYVSQKRMMTFNKAEFIDNSLFCYISVDNIGIDIGNNIAIEQLKNNEICFFFGYNDVSKVIKIKFY